jgi:hypothetical protein
MEKVMPHNSFCISVPKAIRTKLGSKDAALEPTTYEAHLVRSEALGGTAVRLTSLCGAVVWIGQDALRSLVQSGEAQVIAPRNSKPALQGVVATLE